MRNLIFAFSLLLTGCATVDQAVLDRIAATIPTCHDEKECEIKWAAARRWVLENADMKIQTYAPDFIQTYNPSSAGLELAASVTKEPLPDGSYRIVARVWCDNPLGCRRPPAEMVQAFNDYVNASYQQP